MKKTALSVSLAALLCVLPACTHTQEVDSDITVKVGEVTVSMLGFFSVDADDLRRLDNATKKGSRPSNISLSEGRAAACQEGSCILRGSKTALNRRALGTIVALHKKALAEGRETRKIDGPITLRCTQAKCVADVVYKTPEPVEFKGTAKVRYEEDYTAFLLGSFLGGMAGAALRHRY